MYFENGKVHCTMYISVVNVMSSFIIQMSKNSGIMCAFDDKDKLTTFYSLRNFLH